MILPQAARSLSDAEEDLMFEQGKFGDQDPEVLQRTSGGSCHSTSGSEHMMSIKLK